VNPSNAELNPICHFLALLRAHPILHVSRMRVKRDETIEKYEGMWCFKRDSETETGEKITYVTLHTLQNPHICGFCNVWVFW